MSKSALRVLEIMEFIAAKPIGCSHTTIAQELNIPKSSLSVLLQDLLSKGYLQRNAESGAFTIGVQVLWLSNSYLRNLNLVKLGQPLVAELFVTLKEFALLAIPVGHEYVTICTESLPSVFAHSLQVGQRGPLFSSAVGKAMLAFMPRQQIDEILAAPRIQVTKQTRRGLRAIEESLAQTRKSGIGFSSEESIAGVLGWAAPVFNAEGLPVAALGIGIPSAQYRESTVPLIVSTLKKSAGKLSTMLGWQGSLAPR